jgi:glycosyltransferase involved in cell wall biosynthesis
VTDVLWATPVVPDRRGGGGHIRQAYLIKALADRAQVHLLVPGRVEDDELRACLASVTEVPCPAVSDPRLNAVRRLASLGQTLFAKYPLEVTRQRIILERLRPHVLERERSCDFVCVEYAGLARLLPAERHARFSLTLHNVLSGMAQQESSIARGWRRRWYWERERTKARRLEQWAVASYDQVIAVSEDDARLLGNRAEVVPNGVDTQHFRRSHLPINHRIVLTGAFYTSPNIDGAEWFAGQVLPKVQERVPDAILELVGRDPVPRVLDLGTIPGVRVYPNVREIVPYVEAARLAVVPLRIGTGTRLKALEGLAAGRPVVGTTTGLEGLGLDSGVHALIADDAESFADAVSRVLTDDDLATRLAAAGRALVEERYSWETIGSRYAETLLGEPDRGRFELPSA